MSKTHPFTQQYSRRQKKRKYRQYTMPRTKRQTSVQQFAFPLNESLVSQKWQVRWPPDYRFKLTIIIIVRILSTFLSLFRNDFHYSGMDCIIGIKFHFQIEDWNLPMVDSFEIMNVDWVVTYVNQKFTKFAKYETIGSSWFQSVWH